MIVVIFNLYDLKTFKTTEQFYSGNYRARLNVNDNVMIEDKAYTIITCGWADEKTQICLIVNFQQKLHYDRKKSRQ